MTYIPKETINAVLARSQGLCELCGGNYKLEMAHIQGKGMGGRHNEAKDQNDSPENVLHLCHICHSAVSHGIKVIVVVGKEKHSCDTCRMRGNRCIEKAKNLGIEEPKCVTTIPHIPTKRWECERPKRL